jgi:AAA15 family ATPase/GTPase
MHLYDSDEPGDAENGHAELADENVLTSVSGDSERYTHEAGIVEVIFMQDFMCHRKLTVNFGRCVHNHTPLRTHASQHLLRHVNFITGANGSGKSAIVAALQLCLGCTARKTGLI